MAGSLKRSPMAVGRLPVVKVTTHRAAPCAGSIAGASGGTPAMFVVLADLLPGLSARGAGQDLKHAFPKLQVFTDLEEHYEVLNGSTIDDLEAQTRHRLTVKDRPPQGHRVRRPPPRRPRPMPLRQPGRRCLIRLRGAAQFRGPPRRSTGRWKPA